LAIGPAKANLNRKLPELVIAKEGRFKTGAIDGGG
jgi:hypothetical protein